MTRIAKGLLVLLTMIALLVVTERRVLSRTRWLPAEMHAPLAGPATLRAESPAPAFDSAFGPLPPPGAASTKPWSGLDSRGSAVSIPPLNCYESVNYLTTGNPQNFLYRTWPADMLQALDDPATFDRLEESLHVGDVVEFRAHWRASNGAMTESTFHVQLCVAAHGMMGGANNEPRFDLIHGVPSYTHRWALCTTREYYAAARAMDAEWISFGRPMTYSICVYRRP